MFLWWKSKEVEDLIFTHFALVEKSLIKSKEALYAYLDGDLEEAKALAEENSDLEGKADDVRREVETALLGGAFLADSRQDLWEIIERVDKIADIGEALLDFLLLQGIEIPEELKPLLRQIIGKSLELFAELKQALHMLFQNLEDVLKHTRAVERLESEIDELERRFTRELFALDLDLAHKTVLWNFVKITTDISDRAEDASDVIEITVAKRRI